MIKKRNLKTEKKVKKVRLKIIHIYVYINLIRNQFKKVRMVASACSIVYAGPDLCAIDQSAFINHVLFISVGLPFSQSPLLAPLVRMAFEGSRWMVSIERQYDACSMR